MRLVPHNWSASWTLLGDRDREAALRICPTVSIGGRDPAMQYNVEFRAADATANPYLVLGVLISAGLAGMTDRLPTPPLLSDDPDGMDEASRQRQGLHRLPQRLDAALAAFEADPVVQGWFDPAARDSFVAVKRTEIALMRDHAPEELCARYRAAY
jgi:glutamine synthetase